MSSTGSFKSTTVSTGSHVVITHTCSPPPQFTNLIETEKSVLRDQERELPPKDFSAEPVVLVTNSLTDDDEFECDREINRITNLERPARLSPEPNHHELLGIRADGLLIHVEPEPHGVDFPEFDAFDVKSSKKVCSSSFSSTKSVQSQSSVEVKQEVSMTTSSESSSVKSVSSEASAAAITQAAVTVEQSSAKEQLDTEAESAVAKETKKGAKVERKSSKAGSKKKGSNAEISKENISVPEDIAKKLGPGESRVFAKVCVANLRRSFADLSKLTEDATPRAPFSGSNSLEYNRINGSRTGPSSLPASNKLSLFSPGYWQQLFNHNSSRKSSFSKFDSLVAKSGSGVAVDNKQQQECVESSEGVATTTSKAEPAKLFCASCTKQVFQMELIRAEKKDWHKNCFRCSSCRKVLSVDTYQSHEQRLYCKPHFKELFQPKAVPADEDAEKERAPDKKSKLQLIICESQPKELPPDVVRASDAPSTGLEDIQIDVRSKFELFEGLKAQDSAVPDKDLEPLPVKRSASVLAKLKKYENSLANGNGDLEGVSDADLHDADAIELQSDEGSGEETTDNSVIKAEIQRKLKNPLQALNEIAHFKQMEQVRSKWEEGTFTRDQMSSEQRKEELQKFRSRLCHGKSGQLKELYEKGIDSNDESGSDARRAEIEELRSERARQFREMFERGEVIRAEEDEEEEGGKVSRNNGVDLEVFEAGVARESKKFFEEVDKKVVSEKEREPEKRPRFVGKTIKSGVSLASPVSLAPGEIVRSSDVKDEPIAIDTAELSSKFKFFETYEDQIARKAKEGRRDSFKRITPPREGIVKTEKDYEEEDGAYRDPNVVRSGEKPEDDTLQKSKTTSKMLSVFRQMEENLSKGDGAKDPIIRPLKQFTPPRDTAPGPRVVESSEEDEEEEEEEPEEGEEPDSGDFRTGEDDFLKEVGSLARARSLRAKFERWEQQENERNRAAGVQDEVAESIESAKNLKAKFEAMRLMGDGGNKENGGRGVPIKVNRFV